MNCNKLMLAICSLASMLFSPMAQAAPLYAATEVVRDIYSFESVTLQESGYLQATQRHAYGNITSLAWRPEEGWRTIGPWVDPFATLSSQGINVSASNDAGLWTGSRFNGSESTLVVGNAMGVTATVPYLSNASSAKHMYSRAINEQGMVVGFLDLPNNYADGTASPPYIDPETGTILNEPVLNTRNGNASFVWTPTGGTKVLPSLPEIYGTGSIAYTMSEATAVNNLGQVVGTDALFGGGNTTAFIWSEANGMRSLGPPPGYYRSFAFDINDNGVVIGNFDKAMSDDSPFTRSSAFVWTEAGGMLALDTLLTPADKAKVGSIVGAKQLNEKGQILAVANTGANLAYVLLTPVPEPTTQGLMLLGLISMCAVVRSKSRQL